jgi:murein DD-endopeptidase MepM/ murein hydrolase activator NlpD
MAEHTLTGYWVPKHRRPSDYAFFKGLNPPVIKIMDGGRPDYEWVYKDLPNTLSVMREWIIDDNNHETWKSALRDPVGTGKRVAKEMIAKAVSIGVDKNKTILMGPFNEPHVWEPGGVEAAVKTTVAYCDELTAQGWRGLALNLSVGWPGNSDTDKVKDTPPKWSDYSPIEAAIKRGNHYLGLHEYWSEKGPEANWGWLAGRALKCPWNVPIIIGECGMSYAVTRSNIPIENQGWQNHISDETYAKQIVNYHNLMVKDSRIRGLCLFLCDYASREWEKKDVEPAYDNILARKGQLAKPAGASEPVPTPKPPTPTPPVPTVPVPVPSGGAHRYPLDTFNVSQFWGIPGGSFRRAKGTGNRGNYLAHEGIDFSAPSGANVYSVADGIVVHVGDYRKEYPGVAGGGYGNYIRVRHKGYDSFYAHLSKQNVKSGDVVKLGQVIGHVGTTGNSTGNHLHFETRLTKPNGQYDNVPGSIYNACVDPITFFAGLDR